jgi:hypothetical protein
LSGLTVYLHRKEDGVEELRQRKLIRIWDGDGDRRPCLVVMRGSNEYDWTTARDIECASRANLSEKGVDNVSPDELEDGIGEAGGIKPLH